MPSGRRGTSSIIIGAGAIGVLVACAGALGQDGAAPAAEAESAPALAPLADVVRDLGSADIETRLGAFDQARGGRFTLRELEGALRTMELTLEQRRRLLSAARQRFETEPRAAMGINFDMAAVDARGAAVSAPVQGFHAFEVLRPRDRIVKADGVTISRRETLQKIIVAHDPGDEVPLVVEREGATIEVTVRLAEFARLGRTMDYTILPLAWEHRSRPYATTEREGLAPIESGLLPASWAPAPEVEEDAELLGQLPSQRLRMLDGNQERTGVVAGGEARRGLGGEGRRGAVQHVVRGGPMIAPIGPVADPAKLDLPALRAARDQLAAIHAALRTQVETRQGRQSERRAMRARVEELQRWIAEYDAEIRRRAVAPPKADPAPAQTPPPR